MSPKTDATRIQREQARVNELIDLLREKPTLTYPEILKELAKRWDKSEDTVKHVVQYAKNKKLITQKKVWMAK